MKIRILDNSLRLRFSRKELEQLEQEGYIKRELRFSPLNAFAYGLYKSEDSTQLSADMVGSEIKVFIPSEVVKDLLETNRVGVENHLFFEGQSLKLLVEKDFKCLTERNEDETDLFDNPLTDGHKC